MDLENVIDLASSEYFVIKCDDKKSIERCKLLRHEIYCLEKDWEPINTKMIETDDYDEYSLHFLVFSRKSQKAIATFRMIISESLPLLAHMPDDSIFNPKKVPNKSVCEISRFSVIQNHRGEILLTILMMLVGYESAKANLIGAFMVIEKSLAVNIKRNKIHCKQVSDEFQHNGKRAIYFCSTADMLAPVNSVVGYIEEAIDCLFEPFYKNVNLLKTSELLKNGS
jgi:N-acyl-L-homoserine lactone synthetase